MQLETPRKGQTFELPSSIITLLAVGADTGGSFSLFECRVAPQQGAPFHRHSDDEAFLVVEGTFQFQIDEQRLQRGAGEFAFVPKNTPHTFLNTNADNEGSLLIITLPAGNHEGFFAEAGEKVSASAPFSRELPNLEKLVTVGKQHGFEFLLPPQA
ncbi:MAG: cupin domain-containing protein [Anaerolineae bacterium]|nr:cupin domain-containing protein [Anaerolineae bacterium]